MRYFFPEGIILSFLEYLTEQTFIDYLFGVVLVAHQGDFLVGLRKLRVRELKTLADWNFGDNSTNLVKCNEIGLTLSALLIELSLHVQVGLCVLHSHLARFAGIDNE